MTKVSSPSKPVSKDGRQLAGEPIQVVMAIQEEGRTKFELDMEKLESLLLHPKVRTKKVVVVSVAGAFRQGKSFLLDFFLRYLDAEGADDWIGDANSPLEGFSWRGGSERDTIGILMWSEPYIRTLPNGDEVAVLLMDTQGAFDSRSTVRECATVFALSTMLSSIQVYNISGNVQEDHLQHLQLFTEYGRLALEKGGGTPFQYLQFLVRDWPYPYEYEYGAAGGDKLIANRLQPDPSQPEELQKIRQHLWSCFDQIRGFLMPHPGLQVATNPHFDGRIADIQPSFVEAIQQFVPLLLSGDKLIVKKINNQQLKGRDLLQYFKAYTKIYQSDEIPEPKSVLQATAEANNLAALATAKDHYTKEMDKICGADYPYVDSQLVEAAHQRNYESSLRQFDECRKMGGEQFSHQYREQLNNELLNLGEHYRLNNAKKNVFAGARTPMCLLGVAFVDYVLWGIIAWVGLGPIQSILQLLFITAIMTFFMWLYVRYSGNYRQIGDSIDEVADFISSQIFQPIVQKVTQEAVSRSLVSNTPRNSKRD